MSHCLNPSAQISIARKPTVLPLSITPASRSIARNPSATAFHRDSIPICQKWTHTPPSATSPAAKVGIACCSSSLLKKSPRLKIFTTRRNTSKIGNFSTIKSSAKKREVVIPEPDYRIPIVLLTVAGGFAYQENLLPAATVGLLGLLLLFQTTRVRFFFDDEALEVKVGNELNESGENVFVGGKNRWKYYSFINWELWWPNFPILVYFKEAQTKPEGQIHLFLVIFNGKQFYDIMVERAGQSKTSAPK